MRANSASGRATVESIEAARHLLSGARRVAVLTGAGISAESGIPTFRGPDGLWKKYNVDELASWEGFSARPDEGWRFYDERRRVVASASPNPGHLALSEWEKRVTTSGGSFHLLTQNVDELHARAGSVGVVELHGSIWKVKCPGCGAVSRDERAPLPEIPPLCARCGHWVRPAVVFFGEMLDSVNVRAATRAAEGCEVMLVVGTSAAVYPAAALPTVARQAGAKVIEVNTEETGMSGTADVVVRKKAGEVLPALFRT
ncbi:MAG TPA: NAD-dependent deacylase [Thermoplasmata archaeon]|nr:NAD-dependent deacylase [Thermoplasmata archaeon]